MSLQSYYGGCGDVSVDFDSVNVSGSRDIRLARFPQRLSDQGRLLLVWGDDSNFAWAENTSLDYQLDYALGPNPNLWKIELNILELLRRMIQDWKIL